MTICICEDSELYTKKGGFNCMCIISQKYLSIKVWHIVIRFISR